MTREEIDSLVETYARTEGVGSTINEWTSSQFDDRSAEINYSLIRHFKPKTVLEFGARTGRCTHDMYRALLKNGGKFKLKSYELQDDLRADAQNRLNAIYGETAPAIGGDVMKAKDLPKSIDYLFVDNSHDIDTTKWVFEDLLKRCVEGCLVQIHDIPFHGDFEIGKTDGVFPESHYIVNLHKAGLLPLKKLYWTFEEGGRMESSWWIYQSLSPAT